MCYTVIYYMSHDVLMADILFLPEQVLNLSEKRYDLAKLNPKVLVVSHNTPLFVVLNTI